MWSHPEGYSTGTTTSQVLFNGTRTLLTNYEVGTIIEFEYSNSGGTYGNINWSWSTSQGAPDHEMILFGLRTGELIDSRRFSGKLWSFKIWDNNVLVRDYVPCYRKEDNVVGMYDIVNDVFYTNLGTGEFLKGSDVSK